MSYLPVVGECCRHVSAFSDGAVEACFDRRDQTQQPHDEYFDDDAHDTPHHP